MGGIGSGGSLRKGIEQKLIEGNAGGRELTPEVQPSGPLGQPPAHLKPKQVELWNELSLIVPPGAVAASDRWSFELLVSLMDKFRSGKAKTADVNQLSSFLARFGLSPADRRRVSPSSGAAAGNDPWAKFDLPRQA
jgi:hypothetical protein